LAAGLRAYSAPPDPLAVLRVPTSKVRRGRWEGRGERSGEGRGNMRHWL